MFNRIINTEGAVALCESAAIKLYRNMRADVQLGMETGRVDLIVGQNWLDINEARWAVAK